MTKEQLAEMLKEHFDLRISVEDDYGTPKVVIQLLMNEDKQVVLETYDYLPLCHT